MSVPSKPPPPYCSAFSFHAVGKLTSKLMFGAVVSTGAMVPFTWQYSPDVLDAATSVALATVAPLLGAPIDVAAILIPPSAEHAVADEIGGVGGAGADCRYWTMNRRNRSAQRRQEIRRKRRGYF